MDRSALSFEENARQVASLRISVHLWHHSGKEFGQIADGCDYEEKRDEYLTDPVKAKEFVEIRLATV